MAKKSFGLAMLAVALAFGMTLTGCYEPRVVDQNLVGEWDLTEGGTLLGAITLRADGSYSWLGINHGAMGWRWSSRRGTVYAAQHGANSAPWFRYRLLDNDRLRVEYADIAIANNVAGVFYLSRGASNMDLVGSWDWTEGEMPGAIVLNADGEYSWLGINYGAQGWRWGSRDGTVFATLGASSSPWFHYELVDRNTLRVEYTGIALTAGVSGVFYLHRGQ